MPLPPSFTSLITHPAPALLFGAHPDTGIPARLIPSPHRLHPRPGFFARRRLRKLLAPLNPAPFADLIEFYSRADGFDFCVVPDTLNGGHRPAFRLLPLAQWRAATQEYLTGSSAWELEGLEHIYAPGSFCVIAASPSEGTVLTLHLRPPHHSAAAAPIGSISYLALDPVLDLHEPVAPNFAALLDWMARDPAKFLSDIGYCSSVLAANGALYSDVPDSYHPDIHTAPAPR